MANDKNEFTERTGIEKTTSKILLVVGVLILAIGILSKLKKIVFSGLVYDTAQGQVNISNPVTGHITGWGFIYIGGIFLVLYLITVLPYRKKN